jgi:predicted negative regulator of RcsB-dependent stress response
VLAHTGDLPSALLLIGTSEEGASKAIAYSQVAEQFNEVGHFERALGIARMIHNQIGYLVPTLTRIATKQWKSGGRREAEKTLREALDAVEREEKTNPDSSTSFLQIAVAQVTVGDRPGALATVDRLDHVLASTEDLGRKEILLQDVAMTQAQMGEIPAALQTADKILPGGLRDFALQVIAEQQAQQGDLRGALETAAHIRDSTWGPFALRRIAHAQAESGDSAGALETIGKLQADSARAEALSGVAFELAVKAHPAAAQILQFAWEAASNAEDEVPPHVLEEIAVARGILGDIAAALDVVARMKQADSRTWPLWNLTEMIVAAGDARGALALAESQDASKPKAYALLGVANGMLEQIDTERKKRRASN